MHEDQRIASRLGAVVEGGQQDVESQNEWWGTVLGSGRVWCGETRQVSCWTGKNKQQSM